MPRISKARIVNFSYNDGNRLIADELFDFENIAHDNALNVLINLANGGGKSVLVQLMMQPVLPRAKVAGRRIESFFRSAADHYYVVLEWMKDNSREKLLTGISMGARQSSSEEETDRGMSARYYTFYTEYQDEANPYSIANLPLSCKEQGRFLPAPFTEIRELAKKSKAALRVYSQDDNPQWQKKLAEYGLVQDEWKMIQDLNSEEGGLGKYFGNFKNSDALMDKLLIPTIERKQNAYTSREDSSLSTMLLSHVEETIKNEESLAEKQTYEHFLTQLEQFKPQAEELWNDHDEAQRSLGNLFAMLDGLDTEINRLSEESAKAKKQLNDLNQQEVQIQHEKASADYYSACEKWDASRAAHQTAADDLADIQRQLDDTTLQLHAQECAGYWNLYQDRQSTLESLQTAIRIQEQGGSRAQEIAALKYSAFFAAQQAEQQCAPALAESSSLHTQVGGEKARADAVCLTAAKNREKAKQDLDQHLGEQTGLQKQTDRLVSQQHLDLQRRLDGAYAAEELEEITAERKKQLAETNQKIEHSRHTLAKLQEQRDQLPEQIAHTNAEILAAQQSFQSLQQEMKQYQEQESALSEIFSCYSLDFGLRFTTYLSDYLKAEQNQTEANKIDLIRKTDIVNAQILAVERGSVHVPDAVIRYLNASGIPYTTGEKYLQDLISEGKLDPQSCLKILHNYPAVAYGILMHEKDKEALTRQDREKWLPAMVPIFDYAQMDTILHLDKHFTGAIAFYSEEYFADRTHYQSNLYLEQHNLQQKRQQLDDQSQLLKQQLLTAQAFSYTSDWKANQEIKQSQKQEELHKLKKALAQQEETKRTLHEKIQHLNEEIQKYNESSWNLSNSVQALQSIAEQMVQEETLQQLIGQKRIVLEQAVHDEAEAKKQAAALADKESALFQQMKELQEQLNEIQAVLSELGKCTVTDTIDGTWKDLYQRYKNLQETENQALTALYTRLHDCQQEMERYQNEIQKRELNKEDYCTLIHDPEQEVLLRKMLKEKDRQRRTAQRTKEDALARMAKDEAQMESAEKAAAAYGDILDKSKIGSNFDCRIQDVRQHKDFICDEDSKRKQRLSDIQTNHTHLKAILDNEERPAETDKICLAQDYTRQIADLKNVRKQCRTKLNQSHDAVCQALNQMVKCFSAGGGGIGAAVSGMSELISGKQGASAYYTLVAQVCAHIENAKRAIAQIETNLTEFQHSRSDLIYHCAQQGKRIYQGLQQMESSSRVMVHSGKPRQKMIRFNMPAEVDSVVAENSIAEEIDLGVRQLLDMRKNSEPDIALKKQAQAIVGSSTLLHKYIRQDSIQVEAYKIDQNPQNSKYRTWEHTQVNNSGAEKFVVYFAVILSLMHYTRSDLNMLQDKALHSTLILDNPFGATSSEHILVPMFAIAKHFRVQMICLSDINKADVINCFDTVIKAVVKRRPMSSNEMLTHEGNELIEHGYYRSEQISLLDN